MSVSYVPSTATLVNIITQTPRTILLPPASERQGRVITVKDVTGLSAINPITISTQGTNTFDGGSNLSQIQTAFAALTFVSRNNNWLLTGTTAPPIPSSFTTLQATTISSATISSIYGAISTQYVVLSTLTGATSFSNLVSTPFFNLALGSTVQNLGQAGYVSTQLVFIPGNRIAFPAVNIPVYFLQDYSTAISSFSTQIGPAIQVGGTSISTFSSLIGPAIQIGGTSISTFSSLIGPAISTGGSGIGGAQLISTVTGLGSVGYVSTQLIYIPNGGNYSFPVVNLPVTYIQDFSTPISTVALFTSNTSNYFSTFLSTMNPGNFTSTVEGLGTAGYISTAAFLALSNYFQATVQDWSTPIISTTYGLGSAGYISSLDPSYTYTKQQVSSFFTALNLNNLLSQQFSSFSSLQAAPNVASTVIGLGTVGYVSTLTLNQAISSFSTLLGPAISSGGSGITAIQSISTNIGLGSFGYVSTQLVLIQNIGTAVQFPPIAIPTAFLQDWSTPLSTFSTSIGPPIAITNTYISSFSTLIGPAIQIGGTSISTFSSLIGPAISTGGSGIGGAQLISTVRGLGSAGYVSTSYVLYSNPPGGFAFPPINIPIGYVQDWSTPLISLSNIVNSVTNNVVNLTNSNIATSNYIPASISSFSTSIAPLFVPRVPIQVLTITTNQTVQAAASGTYFFYTTLTSGLTISLPTPSAAQSGWFISIQNTTSSTFPITVLTTPSTQIVPTSTIKFLTDGISYYFI